jgi:hypothetical protein
VNGATGTEGNFKFSWSECVGDTCSFFPHVGERGPSVCWCSCDWLPFYCLTAGRFMWVNREGIVVQDVVDDVHLLLVFFSV